MQHSYNEIICSTKKDDNRSVHSDREKCLRYIKRKHQTAAWNIQGNSLCGWKPTQICWKEYRKILEAYMINWNECDRKVAFTFHIIAYYTEFSPHEYECFCILNTEIAYLCMYYCFLSIFHMYIYILLKCISPLCLSPVCSASGSCLIHVSVESFAIILLLPHSSFIIRMKTCLSQFSYFTFYNKQINKPAVFRMFASCPVLVMPKSEWLKTELFWLISDWIFRTAFFPCSGGPKWGWRMLGWTGEFTEPFMF